LNRNPTSKLFGDLFDRGADAKVPQRRIFPVMASSMARRDGCGVACKSAQADINWPLWQ
jgi:hypothetical protein